MQLMGNVTEKVRPQALRQQAAILLNFCKSVLQPEHEQLQMAMEEYEQMLCAEEQRTAA